MCLESHSALKFLLILNEKGYEHISLAEIKLIYYRLLYYKVKKLQYGPTSYVELMPHRTVTLGLDSILSLVTGGFRSAQ